jgi:outer membrane protein
MKKLFLSMALLAAGTASYAQISAGTMMLGGTIGFGTGSSKTETTGSTIPALNVSVDGPSSSSFNISPTFGYFISDNMAVGAALNFGTSTTTTKASYDPNSPGGLSIPPAVGETPVDQEDKTTGFGISLFANKYNEMSEKWMWFYGANLGFGMNSGTITDVKETAPGSGVYAPYERDKPSTTNIGLGANLGVLCFLNENWGLQAGLTNLVGINYSSSSSESPAGGGGTTETTAWVQ